MPTMKTLMGGWIVAMIASLTVGIGTLWFAVWVILKILKHFGIIG